VARGVERMSAPEALRWGLDRHHPRIAFASSFGAEDLVIIDLLMKIRSDARVFTLDTGRLPEETYQVMESVRRRYGIRIEVFAPERERVEALEREKGFFSFRESVASRRECCAIRKVEPLKRALAGLDAWITGLRREQSIARQAVTLYGPDETFPGLFKLNPLAEWSLERVWRYLHDHRLPYNALHDAGYPSIGCAPCTRAVLPGEDLRAGRWWWERPSEKECGLHGGSAARPARPDSGAIRTDGGEIRPRR
jgi:phosphoadenosine phosphosulfate reductase